MTRRPPPRSLASRLYSAGLRLIPSRIRPRCGPPMSAMFDDAMADLEGLPRFRFVLRAWIDLLLLAAGERLRPGVGHSGTDRTAPAPPRLSTTLSEARADLAYSLRALARAPGRTAVIVATLTLGIGLNGAIFSFVNGLLLRPLPYHEPARLVQLSETAADFRTMDVSLPDFALWRAETRTFDGMFAFDDAGFLLAGSDGAERVEGAVVSPGFLDVLGIDPARGRGFAADEESPDRSDVAIVSHRLWEARFGGPFGSAETTIVLNGRTRRVVGIAPPDFHFPEVADVWVPLAFEPTEADPFDYGYDVIGRLRDGATVDDARADGERIATLLTAAHPGRKDGMGTSVYPLRYADVPGGLAAASVVALATVALLLLVACTNVATLLLARGEDRRAEMATRRAMGASRGRLVRLVLTECALLALLGSVGAVVVAANAGPVLSALLPAERPYWLAFELDWAVLGWTLLAGIATAVGIGAAPALQAGRSLLPTSSRHVTGSPGQRLVVVQVAVAAFLFAISGVTLRALTVMSSTDPGLDPRDIVVLDVVLPPWDYPSAEERTAAVRRVVEGARGVGGVTDVAIVEAVPFVGSGAEVSVEVAGRPSGTAGTAVLDPIHGPYFRMLGIEIVQGRPPTDDEMRDGAAVAVVTRTLADQLWPGGDAAGQRLRHSAAGSRSPTVGPDRPWLTVVGVSADVRSEGLGDAVRGRVYSPWMREQATGFSLLVESTRPIQPLVREVREAIVATDPGAGFRQPTTLAAGLRYSLWIERLATGLIGAFSALALLLALLGIHGSVSHATRRRRREFGVRVALGASIPTLRSEVTLDALRRVGGGIAVGLIAAAIGTRLAAPLLPWAGVADVGMLATAASLMVAAAAVASYLPARSATRGDPSAVLRTE